MRKQQILEKKLSKLDCHGNINDDVHVHQDIFFREGGGGAQILTPGLNVVKAFLSAIDASCGWWNWSYYEFKDTFEEN